MKVEKGLVQEAGKLLENAHNVVITNHVNPDGDAMGSALGLYGVLKKKGISAKVVVPNPYPGFLQWMQGNDEVVIFEYKQEEGKKLVEQADLIVHLDYNSLKRSGPMEEALTASKAQKIIIDHHQQPEGFADVLLSDPDMSSTSEMVFHLLEGLGWERQLDKDTANCLYAGLITDTGNFRFSSTTPDTHRIAGALLSLGVKSNVIASRIYDSNSPGRLKLLSCALRETEILPQYRTAIISLSEKDLDENNFRKGDTEGFVNYGLSVKGVELSIFAYPREGKVKMSFRSKTDFDVNLFARNHFSGGGHSNAAGGVSHDSLKATIQKIKEALPEYENALQSL